MKKTYLKFVRAIAIAENAVCAAGLVLATVLTFAQVLNRYWLHYEIMWLSDLTLYFFVFTVFLIMATTAREESHTVVDILETQLFSGPVAHPVYKICVCLCSLAILIAAIPIFYAYLLRAIKFPEYGTLVRWFNTSWLIEIMFVMFVLSIFHTIHNTGLHILDLKAALGGARGAESAGKTGEEAPE